MSKRNQKPDPKRKPKRQSKSSSQPDQQEESFTCPKCGASIPEGRYVGHLNMHYGAGA